MLQSFIYFESGDETLQEYAGKNVVPTGCCRKQTQKGGFCLNESVQKLQLHFDNTLTSAKTKFPEVW